MFSKPVCFRVLCVALSLFGLSTMSSRSLSQVVWPPAPVHPTDSPLGTGTFKDNSGRTYKITFLDVVNAPIAPGGNIVPGPAITIISGSITTNTGTFPFSNTYTYNSGLYNAASTWYGTSMGAQSDLWRIGSIQGSLAASRFSLSGTISGTANPVFRYKIVCTSQINANFGVNVRIANGVTGVQEHALSGSKPSDGATAIGGYVGLALTATSTGGDTFTTQGKYRGSDTFQPVTFANSVGYFFTNTPVQISGSFSNSGTGSAEPEVDAQNSWEAFPSKSSGHRLMLTIVLPVGLRFIR